MYKHGQKVTIPGDWSEAEIVGTGPCRVSLKFKNGSIILGVDITSLIPIEVYNPGEMVETRIGDKWIKSKVIRVNESKHKNRYFVYDLEFETGCVKRNVLAMFLRKITKEEKKNMGPNYGKSLLDDWTDAFVYALGVKPKFQIGQRVKCSNGMIGHIEVIDMAGTNPYTVNVNGQKVYCKGSEINDATKLYGIIVNQNIFYKIFTKDELTKYIEKNKEVMQDKVVVELGNFLPIKIDKQVVITAKVEGL